MTDQSQPGACATSLPHLDCGGLDLLLSQTATQIATAAGCATKTSQLSFYCEPLQTTLAVSGSALPAGALAGPGQIVPPRGDRVFWLRQDRCSGNPKHFAGQQGG